MIFVQQLQHIGELYECFFPCKSSKTLHFYHLIIIVTIVLVVTRAILISLQVVWLEEKSAVFYIHFQFFVASTTKNWFGLQIFT